VGSNRVVLVSNDGGSTLKRLSFLAFAYAMHFC
jgi:hypothetical protein